MVQERTIEATRARDRPKAFGVGRICAEPGCETLLSRYNPDTLCSLHADEDDVGEKH